MQTFSGFRTRELEFLYNTCVEKLLYILQTKILKIDNNKQYNQDKFVSQFTNIYEKLIVLEQSKLIAPKFSDCLSDLANNYCIKTIQELPQIEEQVYTPEIRKKRGQQLSPSQPIKIMIGQNIQHNNLKVQKQKDEPKTYNLNAQINKPRHFQSVQTGYSRCDDIQQEPQLCSSFDNTHPKKLKMQKSQERFQKTAEQQSLRIKSYNTIDCIENSMQNSDSEYIKSQQQIEQQMKFSVRMQQLNQIYRKNNRRHYRSVDIQKSQSSKIQIQRNIKEIENEQIEVNIRI